MLIIVDAALPKRLATELRYRGYEAHSVASICATDTKDPPLLWLLCDRFEGEEILLVTADDNLPRDHPATVAATGIFVATIDPRAQLPGLELDAFRRDVVHRHAHRIAVQGHQVMRYGLRSGRVWKARTSRARRRARSSISPQHVEQPPGTVGNDG